MSGRNKEALLQTLLKSRRVSSSDPCLTPLTGGVSSEIYVVTDGERRFVVKRALPKLRTRDDWYADPARNAVEVACIEFIERVSPGSVPRILFHDPEEGLFGMEFLGGEFSNWKGDLLEGKTREADAERAGRLLGILHRSSWGDEAAGRRFDTIENFGALRIEAYLVTAGRRNPGLRGLFDAEAARLRESVIALVHGDYSPKNILRTDTRLVLLDCEVAWFGDPAFDLAFLLNHMFLKSLLLPARAGDYLNLARIARRHYNEQIGTHATPDLAVRVGRLLLMLLLARVDGKSPVEYLVDPAKQQFIRLFVGELLLAGVFEFEAILDAWRQRLASDQAANDELTHWRRT